MFVYLNYIFHIISKHFLTISWQIIKPSYSDYDYEYNYGDSGTPYKVVEEDQYYDDYKNEHTFSQHSPKSVPTPNTNYQKQNSGNKRHIGHNVNSGHHPQNVIAPNPSSPRNVNRFHFNEQPKLSYSNQVSIKGIAL